MNVFYTETLKFSLFYHILKINNMEN